MLAPRGTCTSTRCDGLGSATCGESTTRRLVGCASTIRPWGAGTLCTLNTPLPGRGASGELKHACMQHASDDDDARTLSVSRRFGAREAAVQRRVTPP